MRTWQALLLSLALGACATPPAVDRVDRLFHDHLFAAASERMSADDVFAVNAAMKRYLRVEIAEQLESKGRQQGLYDALYSKGQLKLQYDSTITRNAVEAFEARSGNCLSLVIMTAALAKQLGLVVRYQRVFSEESWSRSGDLYFSSGHVNITLGRKSGDPRVLFSNERNLLTIDFIPLRRNAVHHAFEIRERTVAAMFMSNRAAESLAQGRIDDAYWWARAAIGQDPGFLSAYNTLGVIYRHHGNLREAEQALAHVLALEPANTHVMSNLALVFKDQGRAVEAEALLRRLAAIEPHPPFHFFNRGLEAMRAGDYATARDLFAKEVDRDAYYHEFHFWLSAAYFGLGEVKLARRHLAIALENSPTRGEHDLYAAKLARIGRN